jgi:phosphate transport system substrate-binding protein
MASRVAALVLLSACGSSTWGAEPHAVQVRGSSTFLPVAQRVAESYMREHPGEAITLTGSGSARGYKSIMDGTTDIALVDGPPPPDLKREMDRQGTKLTSLTVAYSAMVGVVHPSNPVTSLTSDQLRHIFTGRITDWKLVGGKTGPIQVFIGSPTSGLTQAWKTAVLGKGEVFMAKAVVLRTGEKPQRVAADPAAITFMASSDVDKHVHALQTGGVAATTQTVLDGSYPLQVSVMLVTGDKPSPATQRFMQYFSVHRQGIELAGLVMAEKK